MAIAIVNIDKTFKLEISSYPNCGNYPCSGDLIPVVFCIGEAITLFWKCSKCGEEVKGENK